MLELRCMEEQRKRKLNRTFRPIALGTAVVLAIGGAIFGGTQLAKAPTDTGTSVPVAATATFERVSPTAAYAMIQANKDNQEFIVLDVRTEEERAVRRLGNTSNIDFYSDVFEDELDNLDKGKTYLVYCRSGNRSGQTFDMMKEMGFAEVYDVQGGIVQWIEDGLPVTQ